MPTFHAPVTTHAANDVFSSSEYNNIGDSLNYLLAGAGSSGRRDNGSNYTIAANTFAAVDSTNLAKTVTLVGTRALIIVSMAMSNSSLNAKVDFDINVNGTRWGAAGTDGSMGSGSAAGVQVNGSFVVLVDGLTPGSNTFQLLWKAQTGTGNLYSGAGSAGTDYIPSFNVWSA